MYTTQKWFAIKNIRVIKTSGNPCEQKRVLTRLAQLFLPLAESFSKQLYTALTTHLLEYNTFNKMQ